MELLTSWLLRVGGSFLTFLVELTNMHGEHHHLFSHLSAFLSRICHLLLLFTIFVTVFFITIDEQHFKSSHDLELYL